jgi:hypothetical protein
MSADEYAAELRRRYPHWTIWFGPATGHWFALPPRDRDIGDFVEAASIQKLISVIEVIQHAPIRKDDPGLYPPLRTVTPRAIPPAQPDPHPPYSLRSERAAPGLLRPGDVPQPPLRRVPVVAWPGGTAR